MGRKSFRKQESKSPKDAGGGATGKKSRSFLLCSTTTVAFCSFFYSIYIQNELTNCMSGKPKPSAQAGGPTISLFSDIEESGDASDPNRVGNDDEVALSSSRSNTGGNRIKQERVLSYSSITVQNAIGGINYCSSNLPNNGPVNLIWAWDDPPTSSAIQTTIRSITPHALPVNIYCGSQACVDTALEVYHNAGASRKRCISIKYIVAPFLAQGTPLEDWIGDHILAKLLSAYNYEETLQVAMQLITVYKFGGIVLLPGSNYTQIFKDENLSKVLNPSGNSQKRALTATTTTTATTDPTGLAVAASPAATTIPATTTTTATTTTPNSTIFWKEGAHLVKPGVGGGILAVAASPQDAVIKELMEEMLSAYHWPNYVPTKWPIKINWDTLLDGLAAYKDFQRIPFKDPKKKSSTSTTSTKSSSKPTVAFKPPRHYGTLSYQARRSYLMSTGNPGMNRGDEMQGLAGLQYMPRLDAFVERDRLDVVSVINSTYFSPTLKVSTKTPPRHATIPTTVFLNAWWGTPRWVWPPPGKLEPIFVAMHLDTPKSKKDVEASKDYLVPNWPIGARDTATHHFFRSIGIHSVFSACMTLTLISSFGNNNEQQQKKDRKTNKILLVDVNPAGVQLLPDRIKQDKNLVTLTAKLKDKDVVDDQVARYFQAHDMKMHLQTAKLVITQRLHVALPAASMGTPVILIMSHNLPGGGGPQGLARFSGLQDAVHTVDAADGPSALATFNYENPPPNPNPEIIELRRNALNVLTICHGDGDIVDAARKFGVIPPSWKYPKEVDDVCKKKDDNEDVEGEDNNKNNEDEETNHNEEDSQTIRIATAINPQWVDQDPILASWIHALYKSNPNQKFVFYFLTNNMNPKQRCLVRWMVLRWFPDAEVYTMRMDDALANLPYVGIKHVPVVTQARLYLPQLFPCVTRLLWIDIDAMVIHPLKQMWNDWKVMPPCGIVARSSVDKLAMPSMLVKLDVKEDPFVLWKRVSNDGLGFNAGVMVMDLEKLRNSRFTETIASHWSFALGGNDQVSMNMQCNGTHGQLDSTWNVFQDYPNDPVNQRPNEWKIVHFQGSKKPWVVKRESHHKKIWSKFAITLVDAIYGPESAKS